MKSTLILLKSLRKSFIWFKSSMLLTASEKGFLLVKARFLLILLCKIKGSLQCSILWKTSFIVAIRLHFLARYSRNFLNILLEHSLSKLDNFDTCEILCSVKLNNFGEINVKQCGTLMILLALRSLSCTSPSANPRIWSGLVKVDFYFRKLPLSSKFFWTEKVSWYLNV